MIRKRNNIKGFTLAEVMMAVAIIIILAGVAFVGVNQYMESMALLERNGIAKEIFVAAQNHLTMAQGQGYLGVTEFGDRIGDDKDGLYTVGLNDSITDVMLPFGSIDETVRASGNFIIRYQKESARVLDVFYWTTNRGRFDISGMDVDEVYNAMAARGNDSKQKHFKSGVLGWFGGEAGAALPTGDPYQAPKIEIHNDDVLYLKVTNPNSDGELIVYVEGVKSGAVAYFNYGGDRPSPKTPNAAVKDNKSKYIVLDDVANKDRLFSGIASFSDIDIKEGPDFYPGEDIRVYAEAYAKGTLAGIGRSKTQTTNSLFQSVETVIDKTKDPATNDTTIYVSNFRHLENLYDDKSKFSPTNIGFVPNAPVKVEQTDDLFWDSPKSETEHYNKSYLTNVAALYDEFGGDYHPAESKVIFGDGSSKADRYVPVSPKNYELVYNGAGYAVWDVNVNYRFDAGLIGSMEGGSISNLELVNFNIISTDGNAGALAGTLTSDSKTSLKTQVTNVIAYNTDRYESTIESIIGTIKDVSMKPATGNIKASSDNKTAGGLIGFVKSSPVVSVTACAAALYVESGGNAGGLIGQVSAPIGLSGCYSGGHTIKNKAVYYDKLTDESIQNGKKINVIGNWNVGGLIGSADLQPGDDPDALAGKIEHCYSTCSAYSRASGSELYTGGLLGYVKGGSIKSCYATGFISGGAETTLKITVEDGIKVVPTIGQFVGHLVNTSLKTTPISNRYYMIVNERVDSEDGYSYLSPVGNEKTIEGVTAIDADVDSYNSFVGAESDWKTAHPYDPALMTYYKVDGKTKYNLKTVFGLGYAYTDKPDYISDYFVVDHYGDWPAPEIFVINEAATPPAAGSS